MTHPPSRFPPAKPAEGDIWPEMLPCGSRVVWRLEGGVWRYQTDTVPTYGEGG